MYTFTVHLPAPIESRRPFGAPRLGDVLDSEVNPYYKKLEIGDIVYNPYTWDVARVLSWKNSKVKVNVYAAYRFIDHERRIHPFSASNQPRMEEWPIRDFIIYSKIVRYSRHIFLQVSPCTRKYSHPFSLETYIQKKKRLRQGEVYG